MFILNFDLLITSVTCLIEIVVLYIVVSWSFLLPFYIILLGLFCLIWILVWLALVYIFAGLCDLFLHCLGLKYNIRLILSLWVYRLAGFLKFNCLVYSYCTPFLQFGVIVGLAFLLHSNVWHLFLNLDGFEDSICLNFVEHICQTKLLWIQLWLKPTWIFLLWFLKWTW